MKKIIVLLIFLCSVSFAEVVHLGADSVGGTSQTSINMMSHGTTGATAGTADSFYVYIVSGSANGLIGALYADDGDAPAALLAVTDSLQTHETGWNAMYFPTSPTLTAGTKYWFGYLGASSRGTYWDAGSADDAQYKTMTYPTFDNPFGTPDGTVARIVSQYVVYTEDGAPTESTIQPDATDTPDDWTNAGGASKVASVTDDVDDNHIYENTSDQRQQFTLTDPSGITDETIDSLEIFWRAKESAADAQAGMELIYDGDTLTGSMENLTGSYVDYTDVFTTAPDGGAWDTTTVKGLVLEVVAGTIGALKTAYVTKIYLTVYYTGVAEVTGRRRKEETIRRQQ